MLARRRWQCTAAEWEALPADEQLERIAFEYHLQKQADSILETLARNKHNSPEVVTLIHLAKLGAMG
jgi:hypothetical protein